MYCRFSPSLVVIVAILLSQCGINILCAAEAELDAKLSEDGKKVTVTVDGKLFAEYLPNHGKMFAEYLKKSGSKPIIWPIIGPYKTISGRTLLDSLRKRRLVERLRTAAFSQSD